MAELDPAAAVVYARAILAEPDPADSRRMELTHYLGQVASKLTGPA